MRLVKLPALSENFEDAETTKTSAACTLPSASQQARCEFRYNWRLHRWKNHG